MEDKKVEKYTFLKNIQFLDIETGLLYCGDSEEIYLEMLSTYIDNEKYNSLNVAYDQKDWEQYRIQVHALKSTSLSIGAVEMSEKAKALEHAAKNNDISYIKKNHNRVMEYYRWLLLSIMKGLDVSIDGNDLREGTFLQEKEQELLPHILVVDDDEMNLQMATRILTDQYRTSCVKSGKEMFTFLEKGIPDLILLDLHMPEMSGFEVIDQLKKNSKYAQVPVVFLTADDDTETEVEGFKAGALDFIAKPFIKEIMVHRINRILELDNLQKYLQREVKKQTQKAEDRGKRLERFTLQVIRALASTVDAKDKYTSGHSTRVAGYALELSRRMGLSKQKQKDIYYAGLVHDIGKIGVPDEIINKAAGLTDDEFAIIKKHTSIGSEILKNVSEKPELEWAARGHHERYDGTGYPDGLKGENISLEARIIAVADSYDAMTSNRSYRKELPKEVVRSEIEKGKGTQFDPDIANIMLQMMEDGIEKVDIIAMYKDIHEDAHKAIYSE